MSLVLLVLVGALLLGAAAGGSLARLGRLRLRHVRLVVLALLAQALGALAVDAAGRWTYPAGLAVSAVLVAVFLALNRAVPGVPLVGLGVALNALVVGLNGAMPVSPAAADRAGARLTDVLAGTDLRHELTGPDTRLALLGDVVPFPLPVLPQVLSPGDVLVAAGLGQLVVTGMLRRPRPSVPRPSVPRSSVPRPSVPRPVPNGERPATGARALVRRGSGRASRGAVAGRDWVRTSPPPAP